MAAIADGKLSLDTLNIQELLNHPILALSKFNQLLFTDGKKFGTLFYVGRQKLPLYGCPLQMVERSKLIAIMADMEDFFHGTHELAGDIEADKDSLLMLIYVWKHLNGLGFCDPRRNLSSITQAIYGIRWCNYFYINQSDPFCDSIYYDLRELIVDKDAAVEVKSMSPQALDLLLQQYHADRRLFLSFKRFVQPEQIGVLLGIEPDDDMKMTAAITKKQSEEKDFRDTYGELLTIVEQKTRTLHKQELAFLMCHFHACLKDVTHYIATPCSEYESPNVRGNIRMLRRIATALNLEVTVDLTSLIEHLNNSAFVPLPLS